MGNHNCETCKFRAKHDKNPKSMMGWLWRWHVNWCPGWKSYMKSLPDHQKMALANHYNLEKYKA